MNLPVWLKLQPPERIPAFTRNISLKERKKELKKKGWCLFSRCALQMRLCILDPVRWIYCLHLLLPEEREGMKGKRGRNGGNAYSSALRLYSPFFFKKKKDDSQTR